MTREPQFRIIKQGELYRCQSMQVISPPDLSTADHFPLQTDWCFISPFNFHASYEDAYQELKQLFYDPIEIITTFKANGEPINDG